MTDPPGGDPGPPLLVTPDPERLQIASLVLAAVGIDHELGRHDTGEWQIQVSPADRLRALEELENFERENRDWPLRPAVEEEFTPTFRAQSVLIIGLLATVFAITGPWADGSPWFAAGAADSTAILQHHQYFRLLTCLTLHANIVHLLGNCLLGGVLLHFYFHLLGNGIGLCGLLFAAALANLLNAAGHGPGHLSIGFSTAVFAVIGILCALNYRRHRWRRPAGLLMPLMAGAALLAMLGSSGAHTDFGAHFFGLLTGLGTGYLLSRRQLFALRHNMTLQSLLGLAGLLLPVVAWYIALS